MSSTAALIEHLYSSLNRHDYEAMAACYHADARFRDIAFDLQGREEISAMWQMICGGDIRASFEVVQADETSGIAKLVDEYTFKETGRPVCSSIESRFRFQDELIIEHHDFCDARLWAAQAIGGILGFAAGRVRFLRALKAQAKLNSFKDGQSQQKQSRVE